jgi:hypothetical protein
MEHKKKLEELNKRSLHKLEEYIKTKEVVLKEDDHKKLHSAKEEWQMAWNKLMEALLVLERIEIYDTDKLDLTNTKQYTKW